MIVIRIPIPPTAQRRPRFSTRGKFVQTYKDKVQVANEGDIMAFLAQHVPEKPLDGPISVSIRAVFTPPKSWSKKKVSEITTDPLNKPKHTKKPDADNLAKQVLDCCTKLGYWTDDAQVSDLWVEKHYDIKSGWVICIDEIGRKTEEFSANAEALHALWSGKWKYEG